MMTSPVHEFELKENPVSVTVSVKQEQSAMDIIFGNNEPPSFVTKEVSFLCLFFFKLLFLVVVLLLNQKPIYL